VIRLDGPWEALSPDERYGLSVLLDASRLLVVDDPAADVVRLTVTDEPAPPPTPVDALTASALSVSPPVVRVRRSLLAAVTAVAGLGAEQATPARDRHGRVPSAANPLVAAGRSREPLVSVVAAALRERAAEGAQHRPYRTLAPWPGGHRWAVAVTHDLDVVSLWPAFTMLRMAELLRRRVWRQARDVGWAALRDGARRPVARALANVLAHERERGIPSTWFVMAGTPTLSTWLAGDLTYRVEREPVRVLLEQIERAGCEIGLHGSFATTSGDAVRGEAERLARVISTPVNGGRQHFLRSLPAVTARGYADAGLRYDASWGYPDRNGFRLGIAGTVPGWDARAATAVPVESVPLTWMDRAMSKYQRVEDPRAWIDDGLQLAGTVREVEGLWVGLWHPNLVTPLGYPGAERVFPALLDGLLGEAPWACTVGAAVQWRAARRGVRAVKVGVEGMQLSADGAWDGPLVLQDRDGASETMTWPR
jgi:hypothetical protein